jgi:hypothetical protein
MSPLRDLPRRRWRALLPLSVAPAAAALPTPAGVALVTIALLGAVAVWRADRRSPLDAWQRRWPGLPLGRVRAFPSDDGAAPLEQLLGEARGLPARLAALPLRAGMRRRRELARVLGAGADLACRIDAAEASRHDRADLVPPLRRQLGSLGDSLRRLDAALERAALGGRPDLLPLLELDRAARDLDARAAGLEELARLEDPRWIA